MVRFSRHCHIRGLGPLNTSIVGDYLYVFGDVCYKSTFVMDELITLKLDGIVGGASNLPVLQLCEILILTTSFGTS